MNGCTDILNTSFLTEDYTERVMYATGSHPRYDGTASAHVATVGGRYDYLFDCHDRLIKAQYTDANAEDGIAALGGDLDVTENFSTEYTYNSVGVPLTVKRYGVQCIDNSSGTPVESFGILDNLSYTYDGMLLSSVLASGSANGEEYYGRTGFPLSALGGLANYEWNAAGLLSKDSAREITGINYNWNGQPTKISFADKGYMSYSYTAAGALRKVETYVLLSGKRATKVSERTYCGDFVFEGDSLLYANFAGGYFDGAGHPHYRHADFQGNIAMVTDATGQIEQHTGYYPYGEPWREPTGQPYLYAAKERLRDHALNDYDFGARRLSSALCLWTTPDPLATDYGPVSPYSYCAANPIKYTDPTGCATFFRNINGNLINVGTDGNDDGRMFLVSESLGFEIETLTNKQKNYEGKVGNSEDMAEITDITSTDIETIEKAVDDGNGDGRERGMNKDENGVVHQWDKGSEVSTNGDTQSHSVRPFIKNGKTCCFPEGSKWYMHVHPTNIANSGFGESDPSNFDKDNDKNMRKNEVKNYSGTTFIVGGKNKSVTFYYGEKIITTVPLSALKAVRNN